jgi:23S rRNA (cytidine1920-2'-O)/16S rRNA (cytidine1409-2'-O)-methyltransferase
MTRVSAAGRRRLDVALAERGLAESRARAQALILAGRVRVNGETVRTASTPVVDNDRLEIAAGERWASRGALKLMPALDTFGLDPGGRACADIGASSGGFTDLLLRRGASRVYAVDVAYGIIDWRLRQDPRVVLMERTNARALAKGSFPEPVSLVVVDVSFITLQAILPAVRAAAPDADVVALFKPQFEVGREHVGKGGVVRDPELVEHALEEFERWCPQAGYQPVGRAAAGLPGPHGNREVFVRLRPEPPR